MPFREKIISTSTIKCFCHIKTKELTQGKPWANKIYIIFQRSQIIPQKPSVKISIKRFKYVMFPIWLDNSFVKNKNIQILNMR